MAGLSLVNLKLFCHFQFSSVLKFELLTTHNLSSLSKTTITIINHGFNDRVLA